MNKFTRLLTILLMVLLPLASFAADHIVFIHGFRGSRDTWANMVRFMTTGEPAYAQESNILCVDYSNRSGDWPIKVLAADVFNQIRARFGSNLPKIDFVVHSMGGLVLRAMVNEGYLSESFIGRVVTLGTPHFGQRFQFSQQTRDMGFASSYIWDLAHAKTKISKNKILCVVGTLDDVVDQWSAALDNPYECAAVRYVPKDHTSFGDYISDDALCECGYGRSDVVYKLVTDFLSSGTVMVGSTSGTDNLGAILYQVVDGRENPIAYNLNANWKSQGIATRVKKADESATLYYDFSTTESANRGIAEIVYGLPDTRGVVPGDYILDIPESRDKSFAAFSTEPITVRRGRTTVVQIHAENVKPLDFLFLIDSTGSMSDDINSVKASARQLIQQKLGDGARNCRVAIADYRDHPVSPYGNSGDYVFRSRCDFTTNSDVAINALNAITVGGGGDIEESVLSALYSSIVDLKWDPKATKTIMLMGDAGPHDPEPWSGYTSSAVLNLAKERGIHIYPMLTGYNSSLATTYQAYAEATGGKVVASSSYASAAEAVQEVIEQSIAANGFETEAVNVTETAGTVTIRVFGGNSSSSASVGYQIVPGTAVNGKDYSAPTAEQRLTWSTGQRCYKEISIPVMQDANSSADKFFSIILSNPVNMGLGGINVCRVDVLDRNSTEMPAENSIYVQALSRQSEGGSVSGSGSYILGSTITLRATAVSGYVFTSWEDGSTSPVRTINSADAQAVAREGVAIFVASFMRLSDLPLPTIISPESVSCKVGEPINWSLEYYSMSAATVTCSDLPSGFTFADGVLSGTPTKTGECTVFFTVTNAKGAVSVSVTFLCVENPVFAGKDGVISGFSPNGAMEVTIPNGITAIGNAAFSGCAAITYVKVPPTVVSIGKNAFSGCTGLTVVLLPRTLEGYLDDSVFAGCSESLKIQYYDVAKVTFEPQGGKLDDPVRLFEVGVPFGELPELHENRWNFLGWVIAAGGGELISKETVVVGDATYYAAWEADMESVDLGFREVEGWEYPLFLTSSTSGGKHMVEFEQYDPIYVRYAFENIAGFSAVNNFTIRFMLDNGIYANSDWKSLEGGRWGWSDVNYMPAELQNLPVGRYTMTCILDADDTVAEVDEGNNEFVVEFVIVPSTKPNLKISSVSVSKAEMTLSESIVVHWRTENAGVGAAPKTSTAFQIFKYDSSAKDWVLKETEWLGCNPLAAGAGRECKHTFAGKTFGAGDYVIRVWADGKDTVHEKNENDNYALTSQEYPITVSKDNASKSSSGVDWQFTKVDESDPSSFYLSTSSTSKKKATTFKVGQTIYMRCGWWNALKKAVSGKMRVTISINGRAGIYFERSDFKKNYYYYTDRALDFLQNLPAGKYTLTATLDSENNWTEKNEKNNVKTIAFTVVDTPKIFGSEEFTCALNESVNWPISSEGTVTCEKLPSGLEYSGGAIVGKATKVGTYTVKITSKNAKGSVSKNIKIIVTNPGFEVSIAKISSLTSDNPSVNVGFGSVVQVYVGVNQRFTLDATPKKDGGSKSAVSSITVSGLPSGMEYSNGVISGAPTKTGTYAIKVVFKNALKWSETFTWKMTVLSLPEWARGRFYGEVHAPEVDAVSENFSMSIGSTGKISGKFKLGGTNWTFSASSFVANAGDVDEPEFVCSVKAKATVKVGKKEKTVVCPLDFALVRDNVSEIASQAEGTFGDGDFHAWRRPGVNIAANSGGTIEMGKSYGQVAEGEGLELVAKPKKGYVFAGWYEDADCTVPLEGAWQDTKYTFTGRGVDTFLFAKFLKASSSEAKAISVFMDAEYTVTPGVNAKIPVDVKSGCRCTVKASNLPDGLTLKRYSNGNYRITGKATTPCRKTVKLKITNDANSEGITHKFKISVVAPPIVVDVALRDFVDGTSSNVESGSALAIYVGVKQEFSIGAEGLDGVANELKVSGLPKGLAFEDGKITGVPAKAGVYTVEIGASNKWNWEGTASFRLEVVALPEWARGRFYGEVHVPEVDAVSVSENFSMSIGSTGKISGKFKLGGTNWTFSASSFVANAGDVDEPEFVCSVKAKATVKVGKKEKTVVCPLDFALVRDNVSEIASQAEGTFGDGDFHAWRRPGVKIEVNSGGKTELSKSYGQAFPGEELKFTAAPKKGYVFCGWYEDAGYAVPCDSSKVDYRSPEYVYVMGEEDRIFHARFELAQADGELALYVNEELISPDDKPRKNFIAEGKMNLYLEVDSLSLPSVSVSGLPSGVKFSASKNKIYGTPKTPGIYTVTVKLTNATVTKAVKRKFTIEVLNLTEANGYFRNGLENGAGEKYALSVGISNIDDFLPSLKLNANVKLAVS